MAGADPKYMNQADYARHRSVVRSTITVWKNRGLLVWNEAGQIDVAQSDASIDARPKNYRGGSTKTLPATDGGQVDLFAEPPPADLTPPIDTNPDNWSTAVAIRVKETYAALSRKAEYEKTIGLLVSIHEVRKQVEAEYSVIRERLLTVPGKIAAGLVGLSAAEIGEAILAEITEALSELHEPSRHGDGGFGSGRPTAPGAPGVQAAVAT